MSFSLSKNKTPFPENDLEKMNLVFQSLLVHPETYQPIHWISDYFDWNLDSLQEKKLRFLLENSVLLETMSVGNIGGNAYKIKDFAFFEITKHGSYSNYIKTVDDANSEIMLEKFERQKLQDEINNLSLESLKFQKENFGLKSQLDKVNLELSKAQKADIPINAMDRKTTITWVIVAALIALAAFVSGIFVGKQ